MDKLYFSDLPLALVISLRRKSSSAVALFTMRDVWWLIPASNALRLAFLPARLRPLLHVWVTNLHPEAVGKNGGPFKRTDEQNTHVPTRTRTISVSFSHRNTCTLCLLFFPTVCPFLFFFFFCLSLDHTHTPPHIPGIWSFCRAAECWRGWQLWPHCFTHLRLDLRSISS